VRRLLLAALVGISCAQPGSAGSAPSPVAPEPTLPTPSASPAATFTASPIPSSVPTQPTPIPLPTFTQLSAPSRDVVWALVAGDHLFRSTDRGETWEERRLPIKVVIGGLMSFVSDREGWFIPAFVPGTACQQQGYELWHTSDAGDSWELLSYAPGPFDNQVFGPLFGQCKRGVLFADPMNGIVSASDPYTPPTVHRTSDGGKTWTRTRLPDPPGFATNGGGNALQPRSLRAVGSILLVDAVAVIDQRPVHYVFRSNDRGASWNVVATLANVNAALVFVSASRWLDLALASSTQETTNGGATWHAFATDYSQAAGVAPEVVFADAGVGYATVRGSVQRSVDGGAHWSGLQTPGTQRP
jgi:photosystem II stability/assembly factor-like uncharacterized protein